MKKSIRFIAVILISFLAMIGCSTTGIRKPLDSVNPSNSDDAQWKLTRIGAKIGYDLINLGIREVNIKEVGDDLYDIELVFELSDQELAEYMLIYGREFAAALIGLISAAGGKSVYQHTLYSGYHFRNVNFTFNGVKVGYLPVRKCNQLIGYQITEDPTRALIFVAENFVSYF